MANGQWGSRPGCSGCGSEMEFTQQSWTRSSASWRASSTQLARWIQRTGHPLRKFPPTTGYQNSAWQLFSQSRQNQPSIPNRLITIFKPELEDSVSATRLNRLTSRVLFYDHLNSESPRRSCIAACHRNYFSNPLPPLAPVAIAKGYQSTSVSGHSSF